MSSDRFPGKVLLPLPLKGGKPMIGWIADQLSESAVKADFIIATSSKSSDDMVYEYCTTQGFQCYRGDEKNVLSRFADICRKYHYDVVIRLTGDNPLLDIPVIEQVIENHIKKKNDYTGTKGLPLGMNVEVVSAKRIIEADAYPELTDDEKEHVTLFIKNRASYQKEILDFGSEEDLGQFRLTVDYPSDFAMFTILFSFYKHPGRSGLNLIRYLQKNYSWIFDINRQNVQKRQYERKEDEIEAAKKILVAAEMHRAVEVLESHIE
ncbi:MAG: hypothetical protein JJU13_21270 [Balneolaceae bacterium]|nr:hypothetical protein [Balneolaceae bacterium]